MISTIMSLPSQEVLNLLNVAFVAFYILDADVWTFCCFADWPPEKFLEFYNAVSQRIAQLVVTGSDANERIGGLLALDRLIDFDGVDAAQKTTRFASYLRSALRSNDTLVLDHAARALGRLAKPGGALTAELVESEIQSALEWLQSERQESRRFAAILVMR